RCVFQCRPPIIGALVGRTLAGGTMSKAKCRTKVHLAPADWVPHTQSTICTTMPLKVLVIDDHPLVQEGVATALEALGHDVDVIAAADSEQGLAAAAANPDIDLVLLDLALPGMSGLGVISALHQRL